MIVLAAILHVVNVMPAFWKVWDATQGQPVARVAAFKQQVILPNLGVYANGEFSTNLLDDDHISKYLTSLEPIAPQMRIVSTRLAQSIDSLEGRFQTELPDFNGDGVVIYILPSFHHFVGQTHDMGDKVGVFFGVDQIVHYGETDRNLGVDVAHELFHIYQYQLHPGFRSDEATLWQKVWIEGSAAFASQALTPGATSAEALGDALATAPTATVKSFACAIHAQWDSRSDDDASAYLDAGTHPSGLPANGGYLIGYLVAMDLARTETIAQIGKVDLSTLEPLMKGRVATLCATGVLH